MSMALTLTPLRCHAPRNNRRISTISTGHFDGELVNVSAVDTRPLVWSAPGTQARKSDALTPALAALDRLTANGRRSDGIHDTRAAPPRSARPRAGR
ncbi:hypothetical protein CYJ23_05535 [Actinomyces oris]|nr:hypothetical protein CYJ23_05535 [Actinomyces oris]